MATIQELEVARYAAVWNDLPQYGEFAPGERYAPIFVQILKDRGVDLREATILDAGCGSGKGALALRALGIRNIALCDLTVEGLINSRRICELPDEQQFPFLTACLWRDLRSVVAGLFHPCRNTVDYVYCCDVLEHIPPQFTMLVVDQLLRVAKRGVFLSVSLEPDVFGVWVGGALHQTVQPFTWWRENVRELGTLVEARDLLNVAIFYLEPRC